MIVVSSAYQPRRFAVAVGVGLLLFYSSVEDAGVAVGDGVFVGMGLGVTIGSHFA